MSDYIVVAECYTEKEALSFCAAMDDAGVDVIYEPPPLTGNYLVDWKLSTAEYILRVPEGQVNVAHKVLEKMDSLFDDAIGEVDPLSEEDLRSLGSKDSTNESVVEEVVDVDAIETRRALNVAIISWLFAPIWPYALWRVLVALDASNSQRGRRRLYVAIVVIALNPLPWVLALIWKAVQAPL